MEKAYFNWSSGKDSALALHRALQSGQYHAGALFSVVRADGALAMHEVSTGLLERQAEAIGIPLVTFPFHPEWTQREYGDAMRRQIEAFKAQGITTALFGDLYLEELRRARDAKCALAGIRTDYPLWGTSPAGALDEFIRLGFKAVVTCVDCSVLPADFVGRTIDRSFLADLPPAADPCGERGEYHSFVYDGPLFRHPVEFTVGGCYSRTYDTGGEARTYGYLELA